MNERAWINANFRIKVQRSKSQAAPKINTLVGVSSLRCLLTPQKYRSTVARLHKLRAQSLTIFPRNMQGLKITFYSK